VTNRLHLASNIKNCAWYPPSTALEDHSHIIFLVLGHLNSAGHLQENDMTHTKIRCFRPSKKLEWIKPGIVTTTSFITSLKIFSSTNLYYGRRHKTIK